MHPSNRDMSRDEIRACLLWNQANPDQTQPEYKIMYEGPRILPMPDLQWVRLHEKLVARRGTQRLETHNAWDTRLGSKTWRVQLRGRNSAHVVQRVALLQRGRVREFTEVPLNSKVV